MGIVGINPKILRPWPDTAGDGILRCRLTEDTPSSIKGCVRYQTHSSYLHNVAPNPQQYTIT